MLHLFVDPDTKLFYHSKELSFNITLSDSESCDFSLNVHIYDFLNNHISWLNYVVDGSNGNYQVTFTGTPSGHHCGGCTIEISGNDTAEDFTHNFLFDISNELPVFTNTIPNQFSHGQDISFEISMIDPENVIDLTDVSVNVYKLIDLSWNLIIDDEHWLQKEIDQSNNNLIDFSGTPLGPDIGRYLIEIEGNDSAENFLESFYFEIINEKPIFGDPPINVFFNSSDLSFIITLSDPESADLSININVYDSSNSSINWLTSNFFDNRFVSFYGISGQQCDDYTIEISGNDTAEDFSHNFQFHLINVESDVLQEIDLKLALGGRIVFQTSSTGPIGTYSNDVAVIDLHKNEQVNTDLSSISITTNSISIFYEFLSEHVLESSNNDISYSFVEIIQLYRDASFETLENHFVNISGSSYEFNAKNYYTLAINDISAAAYSAYTSDTISISYEKLDLSTNAINISENEYNILKNYTSSLLITMEGIGNSIINWKQTNDLLNIISQYQISYDTLNDRSKLQEYITTINEKNFVSGLSTTVDLTFKPLLANNVEEYYIRYGWRKISSLMNY